MRESTIL